MRTSDPLKSQITERIDAPKIGERTQTGKRLHRIRKEKRQVRNHCDQGAEEHRFSVRCFFQINCRSQQQQRQLGANHHGKAHARQKRTQTGEQEQRECHRQRDDAIGM